MPETVKCLCGANLTPESLVKHFCEYNNERFRLAPHGMYARGIRIDDNPVTRDAMRKREEYLYGA